MVKACKKVGLDFMQTEFEEGSKSRGEVFMEMISAQNKVLEALVEQISWFQVREILVKCWNINIEYRYCNYEKSFTIWKEPYLSQLRKGL
jgi:hypothetical protein